MITRSLRSRYLGVLLAVEGPLLERSRSKKALAMSFLLKSGTAVNRCYEYRERL